MTAFVMRCASFGWNAQSRTALVHAAFLVAFAIGVDIAEVRVTDSPQGDIDFVGWT